MKNLKTKDVDHLIEKIFKGIKYKLKQHLYSGMYSGIEYDSRKVKEGDIFVALKGSHSDGHRYIDSAIENGAKMVVVSEDTESIDSKVNIVRVDNTRQYLGRIASNFYDYPQGRLKVVGITGTNGKTTTAYLIHKLLPDSAFVGSTGIIIGDTFYPPVNTTPESLDIIKYAREAASAGCRYFILEVSSEGIDNHRIEGLEFDGAVFTNLSREHLDHHKTMDNYFDSKTRIFSQVKQEGIAVISEEDSYGRELIKRYPEAVTFGFKSGYYQGKAADISLDMMSAEISTPHTKLNIETSLIGEYNLLNILAAAAIVDRFEGIDETFAEKLKKLRYVQGRMQSFCFNGATIIVDYAHTEDALENLLKTLSSCPHKRLLTLISGTGERDPGKRKGLGLIASKYSGYIMISSNSPRWEEPMKIAREVAGGIPENSRYHYEIEVIREKAVERIISLAGAGDIVVLTGKGHESYQEIEGRKIPYSEIQLVKNITSK